MLEMLAPVGSQPGVCESLTHGGEQQRSVREPRHSVGESQPNAGESRQNEMSQQQNGVEQQQNGVEQQQNVDELQPSVVLQQHSAVEQQPSAREQLVDVLLCLSAGSPLLPNRRLWLSCASSPYPAALLCLVKRYA